MDSARWEQIQALFHDATALPESERQAFLEARCAGDRAMLDEVLVMLQADGRNTSLLDRGLPDVASRMVGATLNTAIPQEIGPYRLKEMLGEGGMGVVWLAERTDAGNRVAIKFLPHAGLSPARRERFALEIKTLARLKHPFIARLYDAGTLDDGTPWFVMEYVEGVRLMEYCREAKRPVDDVLRLFRSVCEAVQYAHGQEIIHRDLKPSNILVERDGTPRLLDFGIARQLQGLNEPTDQTRQGLRFWSPDYAAPEWVRDGTVGFYTDVYSLGVILYEMLTGRLPFERSPGAPEGVESLAPDMPPDKPSAVVRRLAGAHGDSLGVSTISKSAWADLDVLCLKAMHQDAQERYQSVEALTRDVDHYLKAEPLEARPDTLRYRVGKFVKRNRRSVVASSAALGLLIGLVIFFTVRLAGERDRANREAAITTAMNRFLSDDLLGKTDPFKSSGAKESLVDAVNQASPQIDLQFKDEPVVAARLHQTIARALDNRSDFARARPEYESAIRLFRQGEGPLSQDAILANLNLAAMESRSTLPGSVARATTLLSDAQTLMSRIAHPRGDLEVRSLTTRGDIAVAENDLQSANRDFSDALSRAEAMPALFNADAQRRIKALVAFTYIRLGDAAKAEPLLREIAKEYSESGGPDSPEALRARIYLSQALLAQGKYAQAVQEENLIYPALVQRLGEDHETTTAILGARAASEGHLGMWDAAIRDDLALHDLDVRKLGPSALLSIAALSDAGQSQCSAGRYLEGESNARTAYQESKQAFGPRAGLTGGSAYALATCLIGLNQLDEASALLQNIDVKATTQLSGDPGVGASIALKQGEIAARRGEYALAGRYAAIAAPVFEGSQADATDKQSFKRLTIAIQSHLRASR